MLQCSITPKACERCEANCSQSEAPHILPAEPYGRYNRDFRWIFGGPALEKRYGVRYPEGAYEKLYNVHYPDNI